MVLMASPYPARIKFEFFQSFIEENGQNCYIINDIGRCFDKVSSMVRNIIHGYGLCGYLVNVVW